MSLLRRIFSRGGTAEPSSRLVEAMKAVATDDTPQSRQRLYAELLRGELLVPSADAAEGRGYRVPGGGGDRYEPVPDKDAAGQVVWPVFTDTAAMEGWRREGGTYVTVEFRELCRMLIASGAAALAINPAGPVRGAVTRTEAELLAHGKAPQWSGRGTATWSVEGETHMLIDAPPRPPREEMIVALADELARHPEVAAAYVFHLAAGAAPAHPCVGVELLAAIADSDGEALLDAAGAAARQGIGEGEFIDVMILDAETLAAVRRVADPFYKGAYSGILNIRPRR